MLVLIFFGTSATGVAFMCQSAFEYATILIVNEQNDHYDKMQKNIVDLKIMQKEFQQYIDILNKRQFTVEEREGINVVLRDFEEIALNISKEVGFFQEDTTVHIFLPPSKKITKCFDNTRNTHLYIERFIRSFENGLSSRFIDRSKKENIIQNFTLLQDELDTL